jgi:hypothetical protein
VTLRTKLILAQVPLALSLLAIGVVSRRTVLALDHNAQNILKDNYQSVLAAQRMREEADALQRLALHHAFAETTPGGEGSRRESSFERQLDVQEHNITEVGEREMTVRLRQSWRRFRDEWDLLMTRAPAEARRVYFDALEPALEALADHGGPADRHR